MRIIDRRQDDNRVEADRLVTEEVMAMNPPCDHPGIIAGQGTLGLEISEASPDLHKVPVQVSDGGLLS